MGTPVPNRPRKVSRAAMRRTLATVQAEQEQQRQLPADLVELINSYTSPQLTDTQLTVVRPFLLKVITASTLVGRDSIRKHRTHLGALAGYALQRGVQLEPAEVLTTAFIDEYVRRGMPGAGDDLRAERRRRLLCLAGTVNPGPTAPARLTPIGYTATRPPYTPAELAVIKRVCGAQPSETKRRNLSAVVALGAGAGLDSIDLRDLLVGHITDDASDGLLVHVQGPRPRIVPVRAGLEQLLRSALTGRHPDELMLGRKPDRHNLAARVVEDAALYKVPHIEASRLRATWLADLMTDTIPIGLLLQAAGLKSARTLVDLLPHLTPWLEHKNLTNTTPEVLRGESR